jgi:hypothetical protein
VTWEAGEFLGYWKSFFKRAFVLEALENGYLDIFNYIHKRPMKSVEELLPTYDYLYDADNNLILKKYLSDSPRNEFLEDLNDAENLKKIKNIDFVKIIGKINNDSTYSAFEVKNDNNEKYWKHGRPIFFGLPLLEEQGFRYGNGDGTVPLFSAEASNILDNREICFQSSHNDLPTDAQQDIIEILTNKRPSEKIDEWQIDDILAGFVHSPVDFQIVSPSGKRLGKNFETGEEFNEIEGAYYTGFNTSTEFFTIPNPEDGEYQILTEGTGSGEYEVEIAKIADSSDGEDAEEAETVITGTAETGKQEEAIVKVEGTKVEKMFLPKPQNEYLSGESGKDSFKDSDHSNSENIDSDSSISDSENQINSPGVKSPEQKQSDIQKMDALKGKVRQFFKAGQIKTRKEARTIAKKLSHIRVHRKRYDIKKSEREVIRQKKSLNRHIRNLIARINGHSPEIISEEARDYLIGILEEIKIE